VAAVRFDSVTRVFAKEQRPAVDGLSLEIPDGEFLVLVGPSGCGKSTTLRMLAGLERVDAGSIWIGDRDVTRVAPQNRDIAMVFQNYALYPHMSVEQNMGFALKMARTPRPQIRVRVGEAARMLALDEFLGRKPGALSGGQRQRVAMGRAIVRNPQVFLMDEPLSNLDAKLRVQTRTEISALQRRLGTTTVYVTHDQVEAMTMGDRVAVMNEGRLQQVDAPKRLFSRPANVFVAGFIGSPPMNLRVGRLDDEGVLLDGYRIPLAREVVARVAATGGGRDRELVVGFRPDAAELTAETEPGLAVVVEEVEELGSEAFAYAAALQDAAEALHTADLVARLPGDSSVSRGQKLRLRVKPDAIHLFSMKTGESLA
jgi:multiple sugar transport system ATP-binding protein